MLKKLMDKLQSWAAANKIKYDPSVIGDPVAMLTEWTPAKSGGANFRTHNLVVIDPNRLEFKASTGTKLFSLVFVLMGITAVIAFSFANSSIIGFSFDIKIIIPVLIGLVFTAAGGLMFYFGTTPIVFDKYKSSFWKGRKAPDDVSERKEIKFFTELGNIYALQIISEYCSGNKSSYYSYELNLVLKSGGRINVVDHGNLKKLREDAQTLSSFLGKPVWDATIIKADNNSLNQIESIRSD